MKKILVVGATNIDIIAKTKNELILHEKNPGITNISFGGVGRNICENLARLNTKPSFYTVIGNDDFGKKALEFLNDLGVKTYFQIENQNTSTFLSVLDHNNDNYISVSSMDILKYLNLTSTINIEKYDIISFDCNSVEFFKILNNQNKIIFVDATSSAKCGILKKYLNQINYLKCTKEEFDKLFKNINLNEIYKYYPFLTIIMTNKTEKIFYNVNGVVFESNVEAVEAINSIGAGDSFSAGFIYGLAQEYPIEICVEIGKDLAKQTVRSEDTVFKNIKVMEIKQ